MPFPPCRHRREPRHRGVYGCHSPKLIGLKLVDPEVCSHCPFVDHHQPGDDPFPPPTVHPEMAVEEMVRLLDGPVAARPPGWEDWEVTRVAYWLASGRFLRALPYQPPEHYHGRGIVIAGGGNRYFPSLYVTIRAIRAVGCRLPIQVWYLGRDAEMPDIYREMLQPFDVDFIDGDEVRRTHPCRILNGWELKVFGILHSPFEEVLSLDADCYPVRDPSFLFDDAGYRRHGAIFWPDLEQSPTLNYRAFGIAPSHRRSIESGQLVVNKRTCWRPLQLAWWYNDHSDWSYLHGYGDKHTFEVAWARCGSAYHRFSEEAPWMQHSLLHTGQAGDVLFVHRCQDKFRFDTGNYLNPQRFSRNRFHRSIPMEGQCFGWLAELAGAFGLQVEKPSTQHDVGADDRSIDNVRVPTIRAFMYTCPARRAVWEGTIARWRACDWGSDPVVIWDDDSASPSRERLNANALRMLRAAAETDADYYLILEDDLLVNLHLRENLENWPPLREARLWMGTLYNPGLILDSLTDQRHAWGSTAVPVVRDGYYGTQAVVLSRAALETVLREWEAPPGLFDLKLSAIANQNDQTIIAHSPSLVQQIPIPSSWGGISHRASDFDPLFRVSRRAFVSTASLEHFYDTIPGWFDFQDLYRDMVTSARPGARFVEIGAWLGRSTAFLAVEILRRGKFIQLHVVDHWRGSVGEPHHYQLLQDTDVYAAFEQHMRRGKVWDAIEVIRADSVEAAARFADNSLDFIFIDGSHDYQSVRRDILAWFPKLRTDGVMAGHDWDRFEVRPAVLSVLAEQEIQVWGSCWLWKGRHRL